jgi:hypothetical protein
MRHITSLDGVGLIARDGQRRERLSLDVDSLRQQAAELRPDEGEAFSDEAEDTARILRSFFVNDRLTRLPVQCSRRLVVLRWLADQFETARDYPESEVNQILNAYNDDHALLRRELVDDGFMARDHGVYWRTDGPDA